MRKLLIYVSAVATLLLVGCSGDPIVNRLPWVYRIEIQQGNVLSRDAVEQLRPGMSKRQVQFILGSPLLADPFHADRWDYYYQYAPGSDGEGEADRQRLTLFFEGDTLARMSGNVEPERSGVAKTAPRQITVDVPPQEIEQPGVLTRLWRWLGFGASDEYGSTPTTTNRDTSEPPAMQAPPIY